jgi:carbon monoxide dehydrogenase subunit G
MQLENSFSINAPPDRVFAFLLDPRNVVGCVPGAELTEQVDDVTFQGRIKVKVGAISLAYSGTGRIAERNDEMRTAILEGEGRETTGPGSGRGKATMSVEPAAGAEGSLVKVVTEFTLTGRVAQFGRGVIEDVSRRMVREVAACIQLNLEQPLPAATSEPVSVDSPRSPARIATAAHVNPATLLLSALWDRLRGLLGAQPR